MPAVVCVLDAVGGQPLGHVLDELGPAERGGVLAVRHAPAADVSDRGVGAQAAVRELDEARGVAVPRLFGGIKLGKHVVGVAGVAGWCSHVDDGSTWCAHVPSC